MLRLVVLRSISILGIVGAVWAWPSVYPHVWEQLQRSSLSGPILASVVIVAGTMILYHGYRNPARPRTHNPRADPITNSTCQQ